LFLFWFCIGWGIPKYQQAVSTLLLTISVNQTIF
jgi:hypothetical protein